MVEADAGFRQEISFDELLTGDEIILVVDDDQDITEPLAEYLIESGFPTAVAHTGKEMWAKLVEGNVALVLLDIGLPDGDGSTMIPNLLLHHPGTAIIMLSGIADIHVAIDCIRSGADDYLAKPVKFNEIFIILKKVLEKRRLAFDNRRYQQDLEQANFRFQLLHQLSLKINSVFLDSTELDRLLYAILVGITSHEGLRFNRAFLALIDEEQQHLRGQLAIGPDCREQASVIWQEIQQQQLGFSELLNNMEKCHCEERDSHINDIVAHIHFPVDDRENIFVRSAVEHRSFLVLGGRCGDVAVPEELCHMLDSDTFLVAPLFSARRPLGVIIVDNYVTRQEIDDKSVAMLELFASQVSVAIEHSQLHHEMEQKIKELEQVTHELEHNKDLLVTAERYSALGQMSAQMMHMLRNPITSIGGLSRILARKNDNPAFGNYLNVMNQETRRLEEILDDLFDFVNHDTPEKSVEEIYPLLGKTLYLLQPAMKKQQIHWELELDEAAPLVEMDVRQVRQMLLHVVRNAMEAMKSGGELILRGFVKDGRVHIQVQDSGIGMSQGDLQLAREPFFTTKTFGSGMGLAMVEKIAASHNGSFSLERIEGGILASLELPLAGLADGQNQHTAA